MLLTITTTLRPATDLGFLLHKHPDRVQEFGQSFGTATVFYPEAGAGALHGGAAAGGRPGRLGRAPAGTRRLHASPSTSTTGRTPRPRCSPWRWATSSARRGAAAATPGPSSPAAPIPLEISIPALPCRGGAEIAHRLFEPLGWRVDAAPIPLDERFPEWGDSPLRAPDASPASCASPTRSTSCTCCCRCSTTAKHYWIAPDEVDKLIRAGEGWLADHPERGLITRRYLAPPRGPGPHGARPPRRARRRGRGPGAAGRGGPAGEDAADGGRRRGRAGRGRAARRRSGTRRCSPCSRSSAPARSSTSAAASGQLLGRLLQRPRFTGSPAWTCRPARSTLAARRLRLDRMPERQARRGSSCSRARSPTPTSGFAGYDAAVLMEVIEHVDPPRLPRARTGRVRRTPGPAHVIVTTPNAEYNVPLRGRSTGLRHPDHRFEWTRAEFAAWAEPGRRDGTATRSSYVPVGDDDPEVGAADPDGECSPG